MVKKNLAPCTYQEFKQYIGLEIAMSFMRYQKISDYWSNKKFAGHSHFRETMSRDRFKKIRGSLTLHPEFDSQESYDRASSDPLYHSRSFLNTFIGRIVAVAVPLGSSAFDEATMGTKARTRARTYMPNKPEKYGIRFYALVGHKYQYIFSLFDNGSGHDNCIPPVLRYVDIFRDLRAPITKLYQENGREKMLEKPTSLWVAQIGHMTKKLKSNDVYSVLNKRHIFMDNFYTRHTLALDLAKFSDGDICIIGTVKGNLIDAINRPNIIKALAQLAQAPRNHWKLVRAHEVVKKPKSKKRKGCTQKNTLDAYLTSTKSKEAEPSSISEKAGYIIWKDKKRVIFYTNGLKFTPSEDILCGSTQEAQDAVHGLAPIKRWTGTESLKRSTFLAPAPIVAYNMFMGSVDIMDQKRASTSVKRKEKHLSTCIFNYVVSLALLNAHAIYDKLLDEKAIQGKKLKHHEFRRQVAAQVCESESEIEITAPPKDIPHVIVEEPVPVSCSGLPHHQISQASGSQAKRFRPTCYVCLMHNQKNSTDAKNPRVATFCRECKLGFHPMCFTAYHNPDGLLDKDLKSFMKSINPPKNKKYLLNEKNLDAMKETPYHFVKKDD